VAVVDIGVNGAHEDLAGKVLPGYNAYDNNNDPSDVHGHGTMVSGVIAAVTGNGKGIAGLAINPVLPLRVCNSSGFCPYGDIASSSNVPQDAVQIPSSSGRGLG
jgi:subtilisin family serine protease